MWVKICGNTNLEDAKLAAELGADALGFVFAESKRRVTPEQVKAITSHLPTHIERVGVVYGHDAAQIAEIIGAAGLNGVQLHGDFDPRLVTQVRGLLGNEIGIIQTLHWVVGSDSSTQMRAELRQIAATNMVDRVLIDSRVGSAGGGTGVAFDWKAARAVLDEFADQLKVIIAGGLRPENVREAIQELHPWGVDVASGVEMSPGRKDPEKLATFLRLAKGV
ncbi:phosphoribosylanthranilate isomerase [Edaphobacter sp. 4G125]|nr:phosphoribosylanthranilate isomerase [Edaphobacter sp. 4G125]